MRQSPGKTHLGAQEPCASSCTPGMLQKLWRATSLSHFFTCSICHISHPKSHHVQMPGGLMKHRRHFWTVQPDQQPVMASSSSPHQQRKWLLCFWLYCILLIIIFMAEAGQKQRTLRIASNSGNKPAEKIWAKGCCTDWVAGDLGCIASCFPLTRADTWWHFSKQQQLDLCYHMKNLILLFPLNLSWTCEQEPAAATTGLAIF